MEYGAAKGTEVLRVYDVEKRSLTDLSGSRGLWTSRWAPDGRYLAAPARVSDGHVDRLADLQDYYVATMDWSGLAPDDSPLVVHNTGRIDIYAITLKRR